MDDLTSSALIGLVRSAFARRGLADASMSGAAAHAPARDKRSLLEAGHARFGADAVLAVGREVLEVPWDPVLEVFRRAPTAAEVLARWERLERYYHSRHRTRIVALGGNWALLEHHASEGPAPALVEDLLIAGLVAGLLQDAGADELEARLEPDAVFLVAGSPRALRAAPASAACFRLRWSSFSPRDRGASVATSESVGSLIEQLRRLLSSDPAQSWRVEDAAAALGLTARTLQRRLRDAGTTFRALLRRTRADSAARLVAEGVPLAETGFACGYADQAHFTREFRSCIGLAPGAYRESLATRER
ncbi:MAG: helix-turn-helix transcriptional regulator [Pseudomonadales bacterium]|jgi:AraC-like DNA-binding protein|nr:helix-turn-helix transcriptional regulator [Pseudomonadales bacterium]